jgi:TPR repeat protein
MLQGTSDISLRVIDWFVTNYAKTHSTAYILNGQEFLVYRDYKSQLKAYSKKLFDPFCRRERIYFQVPNHPSFLTTVAKLNFFRWAIEKDILNYIKLNQEAVEKEMNQSMKEIAKSRTPPQTGSSISSTETTQTVATTETTSSTRSTTRRRITNKDSAPIKMMQKHSFDTEMSFA